MRRKVVCIKDSWADHGQPNISGYPKKDSIYHVVDESLCPCGCGTLGYELEEFPTVEVFGLGLVRQMWRADWFRDIVEPPPLSNVTVDELLESIKVMEPEPALVDEWSADEFHRLYYGVK